MQIGFPERAPRHQLVMLSEISLTGFGAFAFLSHDDEAMTRNPTCDVAIQEKLRARSLRSHPACP
jgi:hypothetical protein